MSQAILYFITETGGHAIPVTYDIIQRQVMLRSNQMVAADAATLASNYAVAAIGQTELGDRAIEFPFLAINDGILNAASAMVGLIGEDSESPYRPFFHDVTSNLASGAIIPTISSTSKPRIGVIGNVRDASSPNRQLTAAELQIVQGYNLLKTNILKVNPYLYYEDNTRIEHTVANVTADVVIWSETDQRALMVTTPARGTCPFPDNLLPALVEGALAFVFRGAFNLEQAQNYYTRWGDALTRLGMKNVQEMITRVATA